jgi:preprotein translocase subunit SecF
MQLYPLRLIKDNTTINFVSLSKFSYPFSIIISILSIILLFTMKLNFGIDFTGGIVLEARIANPDLGNIRSVLTELNIGDISVNSFGSEGDVMVKIGAPDSESVSSLAAKVKSELLDKVSNKIEFRKVDFVGPQVGSELIYSGIQALSLAFFAIMIYVWFRFEWQFGLGVLIALVHNIILSLGFLSITQIDFNLTTIAALLTIIGYSVNDSVVIYDRIRENLRKYKNKSIDDIINSSVNETLSRTTLTVITTLIANLALIVYGGEAIAAFSKPVFFGIVAGTYSSIFISASILKKLGLDRLQ